MRKKIVCTAMVGCMLVTSFTPVFASSSKVESYPILKVESSVVTGSAINASKAAITLSLKEAVALMKTVGSRAETAELNKKSDLAVSNGYSEKASTIKKTLEDLDKLDSVSDATLTYLGYTRSKVMELSYEAQVAGATQSNKKILNLRKSFAMENMENNYRADLNKIEQDTIKLYYTVLLAEDNYKIAKDNFTVQEKNLKTINAKKSVGLLSKKDVLQSQSAVLDAEKEVRAAKTKMDYAHMSFNYLLGFDILQEVSFTDKLTEVTEAGIGVNLAIGNAQKNRNEIRGANFAKDIYKILLEDVSAYPKYSSTYLKAQINLLTAEKTAKDAWTQIEIDIRNRNAELQDKEAALKAAKALQSYAEEGARLIALTNEEGLSTVDELLNAQVNVYKAKLNVSKAIADYNMAFNELKDAQGVGTMRIPL